MAVFLILKEQFMWNETWEGHINLGMSDIARQGTSNEFRKGC